MAIRRKSKVSITALLKAYEPDAETTISEKMSHLCEYMRKHAPGQPISWPWVVKICLRNQVGRLPSEDNKDVDRAKSHLSRAKSRTREIYSRNIMHIPGYGIRSTTNATEDARYPYMQSVARAANSIRTAASIRNTFNAKDINDKELRGYVDRTTPRLKIGETKLLPAFDAKPGLDSEEGDE